MALEGLEQMVVDGPVMAEDDELGVGVVLEQVGHVAGDERGLCDARGAALLGAELCHV